MHLFRQLNIILTCCREHKYPLSHSGLKKKAGLNTLQRHWLQLQQGWHMQPQDTGPRGYLLLFFTHSIFTGCLEFHFVKMSVLVAYGRQAQCVWSVPDAWGLGGVSCPGWVMTKPCTLQSWLSATYLTVVMTGVLLPSAWSPQMWSDFHRLRIQTMGVSDSLSVISRYFFFFWTGCHCFWTMEEQLYCSE